MRASGRWLVIFVLALGSVAWPVPWQDSVIYEKDFEDSAYVVGNTVVGVDGWTRVAGGTSGSDTRIQLAVGHGKVLDGYRSGTAEEVSHGFGTVVSTGQAILTFDVLRYNNGSASGDSWLGVREPTKEVSYLSMRSAGNNTGTFMLARYTNGVSGAITYDTVGSFTEDTWYGLNFLYRFTGDNAKTYDFCAYDKATGQVVAYRKSYPFDATAAVASEFRFRTYSPADSGLRGDNLTFEDPDVFAGDFHGDFDRLPVGTRPDLYAPLGGWQISEQTSPECRELNVNEITIAQKPGAAAGDLALHLDIAGGSSVHTFAERMLDTPYVAGQHKFVVEHEEVTVAGKCGADFSVSDGTTRNTAAQFGLRDEGGTYVKAWPASGSQNLAPWTPGCTYQFRCSTDLETDAFDLYIRSSDDTRYPRWTQIGRQIGFSAGTTATEQLDRVVFGQYYRPCETYVDNVVPYSTEGLPLSIHYRNDFDHYATGLLVNQDNRSGPDGWGQTTWGRGGASVVPDTWTGSGNLVAATPRSDQPWVYVYQDMDVVVETGVVDFKVDAMWSGGSRADSRAWFMLGDTNLFTDQTSWENSVAPAAAAFGFRNNSFCVVDGPNNGDIASKLVLGPGFSPDTWYTFVCRAFMAGANRNTWELDVLDRATGQVLWSQTGLGFPTDYTDVLRFGLAVADIGATAPCTVYFDNLDLRDAPEPATLVLLGGGLVAMARRRRRK